MNKTRYFMLATGVLLLLMLVPAGLRSEVFLIVAPDEFMDELQPLKTFKDSTARPTILVSLSEVYTNFTGADEAEKVKRCIEYYEKTKGIRYVMLVGDVSKFPVRWRWWGLPGQENWAVSDLYYADLYKQGTKNFDSWDSNGNGLYGEIEFRNDSDGEDGVINNEPIDFLPDVAVGRISASTEAEVTAYVNKVMSYETNTSPSDSWFRTAALYLGTWLNAQAAMDEVKNSLKKRDNDFVFIERSADWRVSPPGPIPGVPNAAVTDLNNGVGFVNYIGHGTADGWACLSFGSSMLTQLSNSSRLPVVFAGACDTGGFAWQARLGPYVDGTGQNHCGVSNGEDLSPGDYPHTTLPKPDPLQQGTIQCPGTLCTSCSLNPPCFAEKILFGNPVGSTGAIAYLGERTGAQENVQDLSRHFFKAYENRYSVLGDMWKYMIEKYYDQFNLQQSHTWSHDPSGWPIGHTFDEPQKLILFGDPSLVVGGGVQNATALCGNVYDGNGGPLMGRYYTVCDLTIPVGQKLTLQPSSKVLLEKGKKIIAYDPDSSNGLIVSASTNDPVRLYTLSADPHGPQRGLVIKSALKVRHGGAIKCY